MNLKYRIWDKQSPINNCPADIAKKDLGILDTDEIYIIVNDNGEDWILQTQQNAPYKGATIEESAQNHINKIIEERTKADEAAKIPTLEDRVKALEEVQLTAMGV